MADLYPFQLPTTTTTALNDVVIVQSNSTGQVDSVLISDFLPDNSVKPNDLQSGTGTSWAWQSYTPTWAASTNPVLGNGTMTGRYVQMGKTVTVTVILTMGSTTTYGFGEWNWTIPVATSTSSAYYFGSSWGVDTGTNYYAGTAKLTTTAGRINIHPSAASGSSYGGAVPFTWGTGDSLGFTITYEAA